MTRSLKALALAAFLVITSCGRAEISAEKWKALSPQDKTLVIESLRGHEAARDAKGGQGSAHPRDTIWYLDEIDARYAKGETRSVSELWTELVEPAK